MRRKLRIARRIAGGLVLAPLLAAGIGLQMAVVGPLFKKNMGVQRLAYAAIRGLIGIKLEFNKNSAPLENKRPTWFVGNHQSQADIIVLGSALNAAFAGKGTFMKSPWIAPIGRAVHYIGLRRVPKDDPDFHRFQEEARGKVCTNFNEGRNLITFQEGTTTDGSEIRQFRGGLLKTLFAREGLDKQGATIALEKDVVVQPIGIKVKSVEGVSAEGRDDLRHYYSHYTTPDTLKRILTRLGTKEIVVELKAFPPMHPADYEDEKALANAACDAIRGYVCPHQTDVRPAEIPNMDKKSDDPAYRSPPAPRQ